MPPKVRRGLRRVKDERIKLLYVMQRGCANAGGGLGRKEAVLFLKKKNQKNFCPFLLLYRNEMGVRLLLGVCGDFLRFGGFGGAVDAPGGGVGLERGLGSGGVLAVFGRHLDADRAGGAGF
jgi:hypothetical protein